MNKPKLKCDRCFKRTVTWEFIKGWFLCKNCREIKEIEMKGDKENE